MIKKKLSSFKVNFLINDLKKLRIKKTTKNKIYKQSDILFLCVSLNDSSRNMLVKKHFKIMKTGLINEKDYKKIVDPKKMIYPA